MVELKGGILKNGSFTELLAILKQNVHARLSIVARIVANSGTSMDWKNGDG